MDEQNVILVWQSCFLAHSASPKKSLTRFSTEFRSFNSHCQITKASQPNFSRALRVSTSRVLFRRSLGSQKSWFVLGTSPVLQEWECQKHPCTNITLRRAGKTRSGFPGRSCLCSRKRKPSRCTRLRTAISGNVSRPRIARMFSLRSIFHSDLEFLS